MGLHRDGEEYSFGAVDTHVRRLLWHQLCLLDIRTCEAQGPKPIIRAEDFDTQFPTNTDDADLEQCQSPPESSQRWTDMTLTLIRMECNEIIRVIWVDRPRLEKKKISLTAVLGKVENFRRMMKEKYMSFIDDRIPVQHAGRLIFEIQSLRMHAMILHRYHNSVAYSIPGRRYEHHVSNGLLTSIDRLRQIIITSGVTVMECAIELETSPPLRIWSWLVTFRAFSSQFYVADSDIRLGTLGPFSNTTMRFSSLSKSMRFPCAKKPIGSGLVLIISTMFPDIYPGNKKADGSSHKSETKRGST